MQEKVKEAVLWWNGDSPESTLSGMTWRRAKKLQKKQPTKQFQAQGTIKQTSQILKICGTVVQMRASTSKVQCSETGFWYFLTVLQGGDGQK